MIALEPSQGLAALRIRLLGDRARVDNAEVRAAAIDTPPPAERLDYVDAYQLVWMQDGMRIELLTNLSHEEMIEIAGSLTAAEPAPDQ